MNATWLEQPQSSISSDELHTEGVLYLSLTTDPAEFQGDIDQLKAERGYVEQDLIELRPDTPELDRICARFEDEHYHDEDEVRFVLSGEGIFDIRSTDDRWMRVTVTAGDLIVVPARRHHRFFLTDARAIRCVRLFKDASGWTPHYR